MTAGHPHDAGTEEAAARRCLTEACRSVGQWFARHPLPDSADPAHAHMVEAETALGFFALSQLCPPGFLAQQLNLLRQGTPARPLRRDGTAPAAPWQESEWPQLAAMTRTALGRAGVELFSPQHLDGPDALATCLAAFKDMPPLDRDRASRLLLDKLGDYAAGRGRGLACGIVPPWLARLMSGMGHPAGGERVRDLAAGAGTLLAEAALAHPLADRVYFVADGVRPPLGILLLHLCGVPATPENFALGQPAPEIGRDTPGNAVQVRDDGASHLTLSAAPAFVPVEQGTEECFWICRHISEALPACGRCVLLTRLGPLFRAEREARMRTELVRRNLLDAVIQLPGNVVQGNNAAPALLLFDRRREQGGPQAGQDSVFMADLSSLGRRSRTLGYLEEAHLEAALELLRERRERPGVSRCVPCADILTQNVWLPSRFLRPDTGEATPPEEQPARIAALEAELSETQTQLDALLARLSSLCPPQQA